MANYNFTASATEAFTVLNAGGGDTVSNVEVLRFDDQDYVITPPSQPPVVFDLDHDGVELISSQTSTVYFDQNNDGILDRTGWVGADDGILVLDRNQDGRITNGTEISFVDDMPGATTDMEGLRFFDSNEDGIFDDQDEKFSDFQIWQDRNQNGISESDELSSLHGYGIAAVSLDLTPTDNKGQIIDDNRIVNIARYQRYDGTQGEVADVMLRYTRERSSAFSDSEGYESTDAIESDMSVDNLIQAMNSFGIQTSSEMGSTKWQMSDQSDFSMLAYSN